MAGVDKLWRIALAAAVGAALSSCADHQQQKPIPEKLYAEAESAYHHGDLALAQGEAEAGYRRFLSSSPEWAGKFRILEINMMVGRGLYELARGELDESTSAVFATCDLAARKSMLDASLYLTAGRGSESAASMKEAEQQCPMPGPLLAADLATRRGVLQGDPSLAEAEYRTALKISREQHDTYREAGALVNLSNASQRREHYDESIAWAIASLRISKGMGYRLYEEMAEGNLAFDHFKLGDFDEAAVLYAEAEESARICGAVHGRSLWRESLGLIHEQTGELKAAEADFRQALDMARQQGDENQTNNALLELAFVSIRTGDWNQAEKLSREGMELARKEEDRPLELQAMLAEGLIAAHKGDEKGAEKLLAEVARDPGHDRQSFRWEAQAALAHLYAEERRVGAARAEYDVALDTVRRARCSIHKEDYRLSFFANATRVYGRYIDFLVSQGKAPEALRIADESRALTLAEGLGIEGKKCLAAETEFDPRRTAREAKATILFYWLGAEHSYLWAVSPARLKIYPLPAAAELDAPLDAYRKALMGSRDPLATGDSAGSALYQTLVAPAEEFFRADSRGAAGRVIVIADGGLSGLNFETLIDPKPRPHYWIEDVCVENASSLRLLAAGGRRRPEGKRSQDKRSQDERSQGKGSQGKGSQGNGSHDKNPQSRPPQNGGRLLLIGDPVPPKASDYAPLPKAAEEMRSVEAYFPGAAAEVYRQSNSTPAAYLDGHPEGFAYIHFVAHGVASRSDPLDSAVVLSPASAGGGDGGYKLYARDVMGHPLRAELVTVSTCKGAGVRSYTGEGLVGLSWAFLHAGAHHVIGALWDVSDESTPRLMAAMYGELVKGSPPDEALRSAKLALLRSGAPFRKPYYWAPFQLYTGS